MVPVLYTPADMPVPVNTVTVGEVMVFTTYTWFMARLAAFPSWPTMVMDSPTINFLGNVSWVMVVSVALLAWFEVTVCPGCSFT